MPLEIFIPKCTEEEEEGDENKDFCHKNDLSYKLNTLGPLCLWQCFLQETNIISNVQMYTTEYI